MVPAVLAVIAASRSPAGEARKETQAGSIFEVATDPVPNALVAGLPSSGVVAAPPPEHPVSTLKAFFESVPPGQRVTLSHEDVAELEPTQRGRRFRLNCP